jgi:D-glycero-D-manno-heptose 1,7-bisphosphate phosphatase
VEKLFDYFMQAVIFCGGYGSRLGPITKYTPKPLLKIKNKYFLDYIIDNIKRFGVTEVLLLSHYKYKKFIKYLDYKKNNISIKVIVEKKKLGTAGSLLNARKYLDKNFYLINGDTFFNINLLDLHFQFHKSKNKNNCIIMSMRKKSGNRYSNFDIKNGVVIKTKKKNIINAGYYYVSKKILRYIKKKHYSLENEVFPILLNQKLILGKLYNLKSNKFVDIGVPKDFYNAHKIISDSIDRKTIFLDRDGVINRDYGYVHTIKKFRWLPKIIETIKFFNDNNFYVFVISNQSGIGRGMYSEKSVFKLHNWINNKLKNFGAHVDDFFIAPYFRESKKYGSSFHKNRRKPNFGMVYEAKKKWKVNLKKSFILGDQESDLELARRLRIKGFLVKNNNSLNIAKRIL